MYVDKSALGLGLMAPKTILAMQNMKLYVGNRRAKSNVCDMMDATQEYVQTHSGRSINIMETPNKERTWFPTWIDEANNAEERKIKITNFQPRQIIKKNKTIMDYASEYVCSMKNPGEICNKINHVRMYKQIWTLFEIVGQNGRGRTGCFTVKEEKSPIIWDFMQKKISKPNDMCFRIWHNFLEWFVNQGCDEKYTFNDKLEWRWRINDSKEHVQYQDEKETRACKRVTLEKMAHEEVNDMEVVCRNGVLCEYVKRSRIKTIHEHERKPHLLNQPIRETDNRRKNRDSTLCVCTDASVKYSMMAGYMMIKDDCEQWEKLSSISTNKWEKNTSYSAEAITMHKAMLMIVEYKCNEKCETTCCISDNRKLVNVLSKNQVVCKDVTQDAGGILE